MLLSEAFNRGDITGVLGALLAGVSIYQAWGAKRAAVAAREAAEQASQRIADRTAQSEAQEARAHLDQAVSAAEGGKLDMALVYLRLARQSLLRLDELFRDSALGNAPDRESHLNGGDSGSTIQGFIKIIAEIERNHRTGHNDGNALVSALYNIRIDLDPILVRYDTRSRHSQEKSK